ncbi:MAG: thioredoxin fold domain-containing protein [Alphaproteobacteria bacterium]
MTHILRLTTYIGAIAILGLTILFGFGLNSAPSLAQSAQTQAQATTNLPKLPDPIQNLVNEGAQIRYLGRDYGVDAWLTIKAGVEQYFYVLPDQKAFLMGVMFDETGKLVTVEQVSRLQNQGDDILDLLKEDFTPQSSDSPLSGPREFEFKSPSEQLFADIEGSNWFPVGQSGAPIMYVIVDPQCPHCHSMIQDMRTNYIDTGRVQMRVIPIGFRDETRAQSAFLLASPNPQTRLFEYLDGNEDALPARADINQQGVQRNLALMQTWKFNVTPMTVYRAKDGSIKIVRGRPQDIPGLVADLGSRT